MSDELDALGDQEGWHVEGAGARVHYRGETDQYSIEYYAPSDCVVYWKVPPTDASGAETDSTVDTAVPVGRSTVPTPLRERVRQDLADAGIDPEIERREL